MSFYNVSVIIPVYNAENTLGCCIDSLINQSIGFENIELILYDDNSTDDSREIILSYSNKYPNVIPLLSDTNSGSPSTGRNKGIERATSDYIMFMDNDDEYKHDMCEVLYNEITAENADIVACNFFNIDDISTIICTPHYREGEVNENKIIFEDDELSNFTDYIIWTKIFRKQMIIDNNITFPEGLLFEDGYFMCLCYMYGRKLVYLKEYVGHIRHVQNTSLSHRDVTYEKNRVILHNSYEIIKEYKKNNYNADLGWVFNEVILGILTNISSSPLLANNKETREILKEVYDFEKFIDFNGSIGGLINIANIFIRNQQYTTAIYYLKLLNSMYQSKFLTKIYRKIFR